jgi:hypothetical protein
MSTLYSENEREGIFTLDMYPHLCLKTVLGFSIHFKVFHGSSSSPK